MPEHDNDKPDVETVVNRALNLWVGTGDMCVYVCTPGVSGRPRAYRFDDARIADTPDLSRRDLRIMRALLADALEQLDQMEAAR